MIVSLARPCSLYLLSCIPVRLCKWVKPMITEGDVLLGCTGQLLTAGMGIQFDKVVSGLIGVHAFTVLGPQVLVLQKMLAAISPTGDPTLHPMPCDRGPLHPARHLSESSWASARAHSEQVASMLTPIKKAVSLACLQLHHRQGALRCHLGDSLSCVLSCTVVLHSCRCTTCHSAS